MNIFDIADMAGVSRKTVQRVLNNNSNVHPDTRDRIKGIMEKYHYEPNASARKLTAKITKTIGLFLVQDVKNYRLYSDDLYYGVVIGGIISHCATRGYKTLISILDIANIEEMLSLYKQKSIDGGLLISWSNMQWAVDRVISAGFQIGVFDQNNIILPSKDIPVPFIDNYRGAYEATQYLLKLGHEDLGIITGDMNVPCSSERLLGFMDALQEKGLKAQKSHIYYGKFSEEDGVAAVEQWIRTDTLPEAVFCSNDLMAYGVLKTLSHYGVSVPTQISVIGFDDVLVSQYTHPTLTTMRVPRVDMAISLTDQLINKLEKITDKALTVNFHTNLIIRNSCSQPREDNELLSRIPH